MDAIMSMLVEALEHLKSSPAEQEAYLRDLGTWPLNDELALELDDIVGAAKPDMTFAARRSVEALERLLKEMSGPNPVWQGPSLYTAPEWAEVRRLAREALAELSATPTRS